MRSPRPMRWCSWWSRGSPSKRTWARAFDRSVRTVRRHQARYVQGGMAALGREEGWRRGRRRISGQRLRSIELLKSQGMSNRAVAHRLGVSEKAIRKLVGASTPAESAQLAFAGMTTAAAGAPPAAGVLLRPHYARADQEGRSAIADDVQRIAAGMCAGI